MYTKTLNRQWIPTVLRVWPGPEDKTVAHICHTSRNIILFQSVTKDQKKNSPAYELSS